MSDISQLSRRNFIKASAVLGGGLMLSFYLPGCKGPVQDVAEYSANAFIRIGTDDIITIIINHAEMGQGSYTALPMLLADELDADWSNIRFEAAPSLGRVYDHPYYPGFQMAGGSTTITSEFEPFRKVGATARAMLIAAAAQTWGVAPSSCKTENQKVIHEATDRSLSYGQLAEKAVKIKPAANVQLKAPKDFKLIGKPIKRLDTAPKINGKAVFGIDVNIPNMLVALVARSPYFGGKAISFNADKTKAIAGVKQVFEIDRGIAVVATGFWAAKLGRDALEINWGKNPLEVLDTPQQQKSYAQLVKQPGLIAKKEGDILTGKKNAVKTIEAVYTLPYLAHALMEPLNCVVDLKTDSCEVWVGTQSASVDHDFIVKFTGLKPEQVTVHTTFLGGGFGKRGQVDGYLMKEGIQISQAVKGPVKVIYTREDDISYGHYRQPTHHVLRGGIDTVGKPVFLEHRFVAAAPFEGTPFGDFIQKAFMGGSPLEVTAIEGTTEVLYDIPNFQVNWINPPKSIPTNNWRAVGHNYGAFVREAFIDELAKTVNEDPYQFRLGLLQKSPRLKKVLEIAAEKSGWGNPLPRGHARGIAVNSGFQSFIGHVVEVSIPNPGQLKIHKVVAVVDCGLAVNPDTVKAQVEGGAIFGLSAVLYGEITIENGRAKQSNFHDYKVLRMHETPVIEVHIVQNTEKMGGIGETGVPTIAPAVVNALFALTGKRIRSLPIRTDDLSVSVKI